MNMQKFMIIYGTSKELVQKISKNHDLIFDIDCRNKQLSKFKELNLLKIFITTKNRNSLKDRLISRNQDSKSEVEKRLKSYNEDINHWNDYDYSDDENLENCFRQIENIILANKNKAQPFS